MTSQKKTAKVVRHPSSLRGDRRLFGDWLREKRFDKGFTQATTVSLLHRPRSQAWLSRFESGRFLRLMPLEEFRDLCRVLRINPVGMLVVCGFIHESEVKEYLAEKSGLRARGSAS